MIMLVHANNQLISIMRTSIKAPLPYHNARHLQQSTITNIASVLVRDPGRMQATCMH